MAGSLRQVLPMTTYTFASDQLAATKTVAIPVALGMDVTQWRELTALLRVHQFTGAAGAKVEAQVYASAPTSEDPSVTFRAGSTLVNPNVDYAGYGTGAVKLYAATATSGLPGTIDVLVKFTQANTATNLTFVISLELALKT